LIANNDEAIDIIITITPTHEIRLVNLEESGTKLIIARDIATG